MYGMDDEWYSIILRANGYSSMSLIQRWFRYLRTERHQVVGMGAKMWTRLLPVKRKYIHIWYTALMDMDENTSMQNQTSVAP